MIRAVIRPQGGDPDSRGVRSGSLDQFGPPYDYRTVLEVLKAWKVSKKWLINPTGLSVNQGVPVVTRDGGPKYMLLFPDGKWRYASFGGLNGPPGFYCPAEGYEAPNGESAHLMRSLEQAIAHRKLAEDEVQHHQNSVASIKQKLAVSMADPVKKDEQV